MPRIYVRKTDRGKWSAEFLVQAFEDVRSNKMTLWEASKWYDIPYRTLKRRMKNNDAVKKVPGPRGTLGLANEAELVQYLQILEKCGFPLKSRNVRQLAYSYVEKNNIPHRFNREKKVTGYDWFQLFMKRHPNLKLRKAQLISKARILGKCHEEVDHYFQLFLKICKENDFFAHSGKIYNMDESGLQLNNDPGIVIATRGAKNVHHVTSNEKGEVISLVACCNAEGHFFPPFSIFKLKTFLIKFFVTTRCKNNFIM